MASNNIVSDIPTSLELHWFVAVLLLESNFAALSMPPSIDVQYRLIHATDSEAAYKRALELGREAEHSYENSEGEICVWSFKGLKDLQEVLDVELNDGTEIYGFTAVGSATDHVVSKQKLTTFSFSNLVPDL